MAPPSLKRLVRSRPGPVRIWYHPAYRLPLASLEATTGFDPRRADLVVSYLVSQGMLRQKWLDWPEPISDEQLLLVHSPDLVAVLSNPDWLASVFRVDASEVVVDEVVRTVRLACGATLQAARAVLGRRGRALNLLGGFCHAGRTRPGPLCALNDVAVAIAALRKEGLKSMVVVLDLGRHAPQGLVDCLRQDQRVWIGALSGPDGGRLEHIDHLLWAAGGGEQAYLELLGELLGRVPRAELAFVIAGGDVLATDRTGGLGLTLAGASLRDREVARTLAGIPTVWLPGGGSGPDAWRALAQTAALLVTGSPITVAAEPDSLELAFAAIARQLDPSELRGEALVGAEELVASRHGTSSRLLDYYTVRGLNYALQHYGVLRHLERLGYRDLELVVDREARGDRLRVLGQAGGERHLLIECVLACETVDHDLFLYVHWLTLRHPRARPRPDHPRLPGQEVPGLGLAREAGELLRRAAARLGLAGVALRPAWLQTAYVALKMGMRFVDPLRQHELESLLEDLGSLSLGELSRALHEGRVTLDGRPYQWKADLMILRLGRQRAEAERTRPELPRARGRFALRPQSPRT